MKSSEVQKNMKIYIIAVKVIKENEQIHRAARNN